MTENKGKLKHPVSSAVTEALYQSSVDGKKKAAEEEPQKDRVHQKCDLNKDEKSRKEK